MNIDPLLKTHLASSLFVSKSYDYAFSIESGEIIPIKAAFKPRLAELVGGAQKFLNTDIQLISQGLARTGPQCVSERLTRDSKIENALANQSAIAVMPTEKCNFRCTYCYESFEKGKMPLAVQQAVAKFISNTIPNFEKNALSWFGGEPLLQPSIIRELSKHFRQECEKHNKRGSISITSNGALIDDPLIKILNEIDLDVIQISLDGPPSIHDKQRIVLGSNNGTHDKIIDGIERILIETSSNVVFRINLDPTKPNISHTIQEWLKGTIFPRFSSFFERLRFHVVPIWNATTTSVSGICLTELYQIQTKLEIDRFISSTLNVEHAAKVMSEVAGFGRLACYAGLPNNYVIGADGMVYKCTVAFDLEANQIGSINKEGKIQGETAKEKLWTEKNVLTDPVCSSCAFGTSCLGVHCPLTRIEENRQPCPPQKVFFEEFTRQLARENENA